MKIYLTACNVRPSAHDVLKQNPAYPSLHFKDVHGGQYKSVRIGLHYRALGIPVTGGVQWFWIGSHEEYNKLIN